jgi:hypothetical protein
MHKNRSVQSPVERIKYSAGLGPKRSEKIPTQSQANGAKARVTNPILATGFQQYVAQEFIPASADKLGSLKKAIQICDV